MTRLVCVEGWSVIGWWSGLRFADFLAAFPPMPGAKWVALRSKYNIATDTENTDSNGNPTYTPDPYYVSIDMGTARHPQALLATEQNGRPLTIGHGAPLRLRGPDEAGPEEHQGHQQHRIHRQGADGLLEQRTGARLFTVRRPVSWTGVLVGRSATRSQCLSH